MEADGKVILSGYTSGNWSGTTKGGGDVIATKIDVDDRGAVTWRWQVRRLGPWFEVRFNMSSTDCSTISIAIFSPPWTSEQFFMNTATAIEARSCHFKGFKVRFSRAISVDVPCFPMYHQHRLVELVYHASNHVHHVHHIRHTNYVHLVNYVDDVGDVPYGILAGTSWFASMPSSIPPCPFTFYHSRSFRSFRSASNC